MSTPAYFSAEELEKISGGSWLNDIKPAKVLAISTDTRLDNRDRIFFALAGERFDAHDFLDKAVESGCEALCIQQGKTSPVPAGIPVIAVKDTLLAMQACAAYHRRRFPELTVLGVTGSVGKTSVKEMLMAICSAASGGRALCTIGNTNNQIGVAQNLLRLTDEYRYAVIEAGTSSPGEIEPLSKMMMPAGAIVNTIAPCHLEKLIDLNGVAREKGTIFSAASGEAAAVFPAETAGKEILIQAAGNNRILTFGMNGCGDVSARFIEGDLAGSRFELTFPDGKSYEVSWQLTGKHNALNAAGAAALAYSAGISPEVIAAALPQTSLPGMRMKKSIINGVTFYNDAYNANPASMRASITLLASVTTLPGRLIAVLGGMRELGENSRQEHRELLAEFQRKLPEALLITVGAEFAGLAENHFENAETAGKYLSDILQPGDTVFAKGSRGNAVEKALPAEAR